MTAVGVSLLPRQARLPAPLASLALENIGRAKDNDTVIHWVLVSIFMRQFKVGESDQQIAIQAETASQMGGRVRILCLQVIALNPGLTL